MHPLGVTVVVLLVVMGVGLVGYGVRTVTRERGAVMTIPATVTAHAPIAVEMITGSRGTRRDVDLTEITLALDGSERALPMPATFTVRRAPALATSTFAVGSTHTAFIVDGRATLDAPSSTHGLVLTALGALLTLGALFAGFVLRTRA